MAWKLIQSQKITELIVAPGNAGTAELGENVPVMADDLDGLLAIAKTRSIDLTVVGRTAPDRWYFRTLPTTWIEDIWSVKKCSSNRGLEDLVK